jgi:hypothetical protein
MKALEANRGPVLRPALLLATAAVAAVGYSAAVEPSRSLMTRQDYVVAVQSIEAQTRFALAGCRALSGRNKEICKAQARAEDRILKAELDARYQGTAAAESAVEAVRLKAQYTVARARCVDLSGDARDSCLRVSYLKL